jgi:hypothetical protein
MDVPAPAEADAADVILPMSLPFEATGSDDS